MGTYDSFAAPEQFGTNSDPAKDATSATAQRQPSEVCHVGEVRHGSAGPRLTDEARETAIERAARSIERHMAEVAAINNRDPHVFSDFADASAARWKAQWARRSMELLIAGRSVEQIARMERERGLA